MVRPKAWRQALRMNVLRGWVVGAWLVAMGMSSLPAWGSDAVTLVTLRRTAEPHAGIAIDYAVKASLGRGVMEAMQRGVPVQFQARATVTRPRWYWRDERIARVTRVWRVAWQPLTADWRVTQGGLVQNFMTLEEALGSFTRANNWLIAEPHRVEPGERYLVQFTWQLDATQLPPPLQIGIGSAASEWNVKVEAAFGVIP